MANANINSQSQGDISSEDSVAPNLDSARLGRSHLNHAFKRILTMVPFPAISIFLWLCNMFSYLWDGGPQLCNVTRYCDELMSLPVLVAPLTAVFIVIALFTLDHILALSPTFNGSKVPTNIEPSPGPDATTSNTDSQSSSSTHAPGGNGRASHRATVALHTLTLAAYALAVAWAASWLVATANASLVLYKDFPDRSNRRKYTQRVLCGYGEAVFDALLAYFMCKAGTSCSMARKAAVEGVRRNSGLDTQEGISLRAHISRFLQGIRRMSLRDLWHQRNTHYATVVQRAANVRARMPCMLKETRASVCDLWNQRTTLDQTILLLLITFTLSLFSFVFYTILTSLSHFRLYNEAAPYDLLCLLAFFFTWTFLLRYHSYRSTGLHPGRSVLTSVIAFLLSALWLYSGFAFINASLTSMVCTPDPSIPPDRPHCMKVGLATALHGIVAGVLGLLSSGSVGAVATMAWRGTAGVQLGEGDTGDGLV